MREINITILYILKALSLIMILKEVCTGDAYIAVLE